VKKGHILIVDDHAPTRTALARILALKGSVVRCAAGVGEALLELDSPPSSIILDLTLPDGNGETILDAVRDRQLETRIVVVSGISDPERLEAVAQRYGPVAILLKPASVDAILSACDGSRQPRPEPSHRDD
jgi:DNA-binding NarL/FixJ family response regulator